MKTNDLIAGAGPSSRTFKRVARGLVFLLSQAVVLQPAAFAANWSIAQQPLFTINPVFPNAVFMIDDSWSMNEYRLPPPEFFSVNNRWPQGATVTVKYGAGTRSVASHSEFTLRSSIHNPLAYDPSITYTPWNDNDKPLAAQGTRPNRSQNFPPADIGGTGGVADPNRLTERDMRFRGFANGNPNAARNWITTARGSVGGPSLTYATGSLVSNRWTFSAQNLRWEQPIANPAGTAIYNPLPGDGPQAADIFTNPPLVCNAQPPCIQWDPIFGNQCVQTQQVQTGTTQQCGQWQTVPVFGQVCTQYQQVQTGWQNGQCLTWQQVQTGWTQGQCLNWNTVPVFQQQCQIVTVVDPTSETGYRQVQQCNNVQVGTQQVCTQYEQLPVFGQQCTSYQQVPVFGQQCVAWGQAQTGTTQQCLQWNTVPVFTDQCVQTAQVQIGQTCTAYDPNWVCPQQNITSDNLTPARYYRYEGSTPATDDDLANPSNYRLVEVDRAGGNNFPVPVDPRTGLARERKDCAALTTCTRVEEMQNYANWFTYYRHRLFAAMAVTSQAAADLKGDLSAIRLGYGRINYSNNGPDPWNPYGARLNSNNFPSLDNDPQPPAHPGAVVRGVRDFTDSPGNPARQQFFDWIFSLNWVGSTPNREAIDSIGKYYLNSSDFGPWSDNPGNGGGRSGDAHASCRRSFAILATDGEWTAIPESPPVPPAQPLITTRAPDPVGAGNGTVTASLATTGPQIQGAGLYQNDTYNYDPAAEPQYSTGNGGVTETLTDVALYWWNRDLRPAVPNSVQKRPNRPDDSFWQSITTFVVGYGLNATMDTPAVRAQIAAGQAVNWPVVDTNPVLTTGGNRVNDTMRAALATRGDFYSANDPDQMRGRIRGVFRAIAQQAFSGTGLGSTSATLTAGSVLFRASFTTQVWTGNLQAFDAMAMANAARNALPEPAPLWSANFPQWDARSIFTSTALNSATVFGFNGLNAQQQADVTSADVVDYIRGKQAGLEANNPDQNGQTLGFRARSTLLGTIVSSSPRFSKAPNFNYQVLPAAGGGGTYAQYVSDNRSNRRTAVYVGANAGMFHAFDANPDPNQGGGRELFAYVPRSVYPILSNLTNVDYSHLYYVDGPVVEGDVYLNGAWKTVVMGSTGAGPAGLFALDVTAPEQFDQNKVLWDITPAEEPDLGKVMNFGYIGSVKYQNGGKWVAVVPNGYQSANNRGVLLVIDMATGQTIRKIDTCKKNNGVDFAANEQGGRCDPSTVKNGLANLSVIFDANRNIVGAYSGDYQGNLWKFDLSSGNPSDWKVETEDPNDGSGNTPAPLFTATNGSNQPQPITAAARAATHPFGGSYVVFGTGKFFEYTDQTNSDVQSIYGIWVRPGDKAPITKAQLQQFQFQENVVNNTVVRTVTNTNGFAWDTRRGWYVDMVPPNQNPAGERVVANPTVERGLLTMVSFQPSTTSDPCAGGGTSFVYVIPMNAYVNNIKASKINGVIGAAMDLVEEEQPVGQPSNTLSKAEASQTSNTTRRSNDQYDVNDKDAQCMKLFSQINVQTGYLPLDCGGVFPIRTWRPIR
jgi:type IV pilus assembly protein PilY1